MQIREALSSFATLADLLAAEKVTQKPQVCLRTVGGQEYTGHIINVRVDYLIFDAGQAKNVQIALNAVESWEVLEQTLLKAI